MQVASTQLTATRPAVGAASLARSHPAASAAVPHQQRKQADMAGLLKSWQRMGGVLTSRATNPYGMAPLFARSHSTIAHAAAATEEAPAGKVKRPASAYSRFVAENYNSIAAENPNLKGVKELGSVIGQKWTNLPEAEKSKYKEAAARAKAIFDEQYPDGPPKAAVKAPKKAKGTRAPSAYNVFVKKRLPIIMQEQNLVTKDAMAAAGKEWSGLSATEKAQYRPAAAA